MDAPWAWAIGGAVALQVLQTIQIAIVGRRVNTVAQSIMPPRRPDWGARCARCGSKVYKSELDEDRVCVACRRENQP